MAENAFIFLVEFPGTVLIPLMKALGNFFFSPISEEFLSYVYKLMPLGNHVLANAMANLLSNVTVIDLIIGFGLPTVLIITIIKWVIGIIM